MGIANPASACQAQYDASKKITADLTTLILQQNEDTEKLNLDNIKEIKNEIKHQKDNKYKQDQQEVIAESEINLQRCIKLATEKGSTSWLSCLPLKSLGYTLNKQEFRDALCLRYNWRIPRMPNHCACGAITDFNHSLSCKKGGYIIMRHNAVRDVEAEQLREVCHDVKIEPELLPTRAGQHLSTNTAERARPDVSAVGLWSPFERSFIDVRIFHPNAPSYLHKNLNQVYSEHEREKKRSYNDRILNIDRGTFTPLVFSTAGGMGKESEAYHRRLAQVIADKRKESYSSFMSFIRTRIRFALLKSTLISVRGVRGKDAYKPDPTVWPSLLCKYIFSRFSKCLSRYHFRGCMEGL